VEFFDFGNSESFHFFKWLGEQPGERGPQALIARAFEAADTDKWLEMGACVSRVVRDKLADILGELLEDVRAGLDVAEDTPGSDMDIIHVNHLLLRHHHGEGHLREALEACQRRVQEGRFVVAQGTDLCYLLLAIRRATFPNCPDFLLLSVPRAKYTQLLA
jgi:hypothetical protein